jgi:hypothetical protein
MMEGGTISKYILTGHWGLGNSDDTVDIPRSLENVLGTINEIERLEDVDSVSKPLRYTIEYAGE